MTIVKIKKQRHKGFCHKKKLKFENCKNCLEATQLDNKIKYLEKDKNDIDSINKVIKNS